MGLRNVTDPPNRQVYERRLRRRWSPLRRLVVGIYDKTVKTILWVGLKAYNALYKLDERVQEYRKGD